MIFLYCINETFYCFISIFYQGVINHFFLEASKLDTDYCV